MLVASVNGADAVSVGDFFDFVVVVDRDIVFVPDGDRVLLPVLLLVSVEELEWEAVWVSVRVSLLLGDKEVVPSPLCVLVMVFVPLSESPRLALRVVDGVPDCGAVNDLLPEEELVTEFVALLLGERLLWVMVLVVDSVSEGDVVPVADPTEYPSLNEGDADDVFVMVSV